MAEDTDITLRTILNHMRGMESRLVERIDGVDRKLSGRMDGLDGKMDRLERRIEKVNANLSQQLDAIDKRLDEIEIEFLPKRVSRIEKHVGLAPLSVSS